ncbi:hypothetical protein [Streptomyces sp. NPDC046985]|uniref:hypothetical protein n=1 Tax=Streptomyces sp. NPDC046985 TaxID=3155377 RepID=UPI0033C313C9
MEAWDDPDCPWCRALLGSGRDPAAPASTRADLRARFRHGGGLAACISRARLVMTPMAVFTVLAALLVALA